MNSDGDNIGSDICAHCVCVYRSQYLQFFILKVSIIKN